LKHPKIWLSLLLGVLIVTPLFIKDDYILNVAVMAGIYVILASSMNITNGYAGVFSMGHSAFYGIGAYTTGILSLRWHTGFWTGLLAAGVAAEALVDVENPRSAVRPLDLPGQPEDALCVP
jgi:branched-chain amino acid transport system permease protein